MYLHQRNLTPSPQLLGLLWLVAVVTLLGSSPCVALDSVEVNVETFVWEESARQYKDDVETCVKNRDSALACLGALLSDADRKLEGQYKRAMQFLSESKIAALRQTERAWISYRDLNCEIRADRKHPDYKSMRELCLLAMTIQRSVELSQIGD
jgi:uncharacterized protein YecT (DUF1311 family)